mmetsp:Transcript_94369/g.244223  ORF Transcript_94369/g.244223 Transcript_94369/m.244223 type:complete len:878 (-) Transcript_94369:88-2721(-)
MCELVSAFARVSAPVRRQLGEACPFRLLIFARTPYFHVRSKDPGSAAQQVRAVNQVWNSLDDEVMEAALRTRFGDDVAFWPQAEFPPGDYAMIMTECVQSKDRKMVVETESNLQNDFISDLAKHLPVIVLQTYGSERVSTTISSMADLVNSGLPLVLIDSRPRSAESNIADLEAAKKELDDLSESLHQPSEADGREAGLVDNFTSSLLAFVKRTLDKKLQHDDEASKKQAGTWLWQAIKLKQRERTDRQSTAAAVKRHKSLSLIKKQSGSTEKTDKDANSDLVVATDMVMRYMGRELEWESKVLQERCTDAINDIGRAEDWQELRERLEENWMKVRSMCFHSYKEVEAFCKDNQWCELVDHGKDTPNGRKQLVVKPEFTKGVDFIEARGLLEQLLMQDFQVGRDWDSNNKTEKKFYSQEGLWLALYDLLKAPNVYTGNLHNLKPLERKLFSIAQIDRLPQENSLEALVLLRRAWTLVDIFSASARRYKFLAKLSYMFLLSLGVLVVAITVLSAMFADSFIATQQRNALLVAALGGTMISGFTTIIDPARKWMQLRGGALALESEIWKFRTRVGEYQPTGGSLSLLGRREADRAAECVFEKALMMVQDKVQQSSGLKETSFYAQATATDDIYMPQDAVDDPDSSERCSCLVRLQRKIFEASYRWGGPTARGPDDTPMGVGRMSYAHMKHGQYEGNSRMKQHPGSHQDSYHFPATPHEYVRWRLMPQLKFYQGRIPQYAMRRRVFQFLLLLSSIGSALLVSIGEYQWTAIVSAASGALAAWQEFVGMAKKLERYSSVSSALSNVLMSWQALPEVDQSNLKNVEAVVERTESLLGSEHAAWLSDAQQAMKMMKEAAAEQKQREQQQAQEGEGPTNKTLNN